MLSLFLPYFMPVVREDGQWHITHDLQVGVLKTYLMRCGIPGGLFWFLSLCFMQSNLVLASIFMGITIPFAFMFGLMLREYADIRSHR